MSELQMVRTVDMVAAEIRALTASMLNNVIEIGRRMQEAKEMLPHGEFGTWIREKTGYSVSAANNFMRLYREYGEDQGSLFGTTAKSQTFGTLSYSKALALLALPADEREEFAEGVHTVGGEEKTVQEMSTRELEQAIRERDAARAAAEQSASDRRAAEQARDKISEDMAIANERIAGLNADLEARDRAVEEATDEVARLTAELEELRSRPIEVAVQVDEAAVEQARKDGEAKGKAAGEAAAKKKLDQAQKDLAAAKAAQLKAEQERKTAAEKLKDAEEKLAQAEATAKAQREQAAKDEKKAALSADKDLALFGLLFDQVQSQINQMHGVLLKFRGKDDITAQRLTKAMLALSAKIGEVAKG